MKLLSRTANNLIGQPMFKLLARAQKMEREGRKILHFEIGDTSFPSPKNAEFSSLHVPFFEL